MRVPGGSDARREGAVPGMTGRMLFVGRQQELALFRERLEAAVQGRGGIVLVAGEPGIGKTRVCEELAAVVDQFGARVLWGRCYEGEGAPAYWPCIEVIRSYARHSGTGPLVSTNILLPLVRPAHDRRHRIT